MLAESLCAAVGERRPDEYALENRRGVVASVQAALVVISNYAAFWLRYEGDIPAVEVRTFLDTIAYLVMTRLIVFLPFNLYSGLWQYTGPLELLRIAAAVGASSFIVGMLVHTPLGPAGYSHSVLVIDTVVLTLLLSGIRLSKRLILQLRRRKGEKRVVIVGAGEAGAMIAREMQLTPCGYEPVGFVDDDPRKTGQMIHGVPVLGGRERLAGSVQELNPHEVLVAMPSADPAVVRSMVERLRPFRVPIMTLPALRDILDGRVAVNQIRELTTEDLLPRPAVDLSIEPLRAVIRGRRVLVTGAGGSIGSELARQLLALAPEALVLLDRHENSLYAITNELVDRFGAGRVTSLVGDITDAARVRQVLELHGPHVVFHAAAHKHVPLMEQNPCEAIKNNVVGTATVAAAADRASVERFIMISTDKAVNPLSVMGATKRIDELMLQLMSTRSTTRYVTVRFGNVLGSNGSVLPRFLEQIKAGGPVTVTHPEMRRYFMLIPEAAQLVLHAAALAEPGMVYVLEMGEPISLVELARNVIRLSGRVPDEEIAIAFAGLRPGEKLSEDLVERGETAEPSSVPKILRVHNACPWNLELFEEQVAELVRLAQRGDASGVVAQLQRILPTYRPSSRAAATSGVVPARAGAA